MEERRQSMERLQRTLEEQNALLNEILLFMGPLATFAKNAQVVVRFGVWLTGAGLAIIGAWQAAEFLFKHKP